MGLHAGFLSPVGVKGIRTVFDTSITDGTLYIAGANEPDMHLKNVLPGRDFELTETADIAEVREGDLCAACGRAHLEIRRGIELGHTFKLGTKYTAADSMDVTYLDNSGEPNRVVMGCYGIGVERLMASVIEKWHDDSGMQFPVTIAPFHIVIAQLGKKAGDRSMAERIYANLGASPGSPLRRPGRIGGRKAKGRRPDRNPGKDSGQPETRKERRGRNKNKAKRRGKHLS